MNTTTAQLKLINSAFDALRWAFDSKNQNWAEHLLKQCEQEERGHRGFMTGFRECHTPDTIGIRQAAKLFAVKRVAEYLNGEKLPKIADYLHTQQSCYIAAAMVAEYAADIRAQWDGKFDVATLTALDYCDFVKTKSQKTEVAA